MHGMKVLEVCIETLDSAEANRRYCNRRNFRTCKKFVLLDPRTFVRYNFSYSKDGVTYIGIHAWFSYASKFRAITQKYKMNEIKSCTKISATTVRVSLLVSLLTSVEE